KAEGINLLSFSGFRSYSRQKTIYNIKKDYHNGNVKKTEEYVAPPGASEHQLGLAMDVKDPSGKNLGPAFGKTKQGIWLKDNCHKYGFIIRYSKEYESVTLYNYEPWHLRYVGVDAAYAINKMDNIPLEWYVSDLRLKIYQYLIME
ncbi:MAG: M15 family metallopeptidase, partial [Christensenellaceae bacterium]|nr:M15 family metallopeptidase [Christensenellaceae bacterium]